MVCRLELLKKQNGGMTLVKWLLILLKPHEMWVDWYQTQSLQIYCKSRQIRFLTMSSG